METHTLFTSQPANIHSSINEAQSGVWHACSNIVIDVSISHFSTSVGECSARRNESMSRLPNALAKLCCNSRNFFFIKDKRKQFNVILNFKANLLDGHHNTLMDVLPYL